MRISENDGIILNRIAREVKLMIRREKYISEVRGFYDSDLIKIITGVRRCGKSVVLEQIMDEIKERTDNIVFLDFEDRATTEEIVTWKDIVSYVDEHRTPELCYVFLDEVQEIDGWQLACKTLRKRNLYVEEMVINPYSEFDYACPYVPDGESVWRIAYGHALLMKVR